MQTIEAQGKSLAEAKSTAAGQLGVAEDQLAVEVLEETKGLFGKSVVRIRATVAEAKPAKKPAAAKAPAKKAVTEAVVEVAEAAPVKESKPKAAPKKAAAKAPAKKEAEAPAVAVEGAEDADEAGPEVMATEEDATALIEMIEHVLELADLTADIKGHSLNGRYVNIQLDGKDVAYLVGKHGEVLNAFQYLINVMANRKIGNGVRVTLDGNDYRLRREQTLTKLAESIAEQVLARGEEAVLDALPAFERRIVHRALGEISGIATYSEGEEPNRRVVIAPAV
jgi:spoIIIJ-associated protein